MLILILICIKQTQTGDFISIMLYFFEHGGDTGAAQNANFFVVLPDMVKTVEYELVLSSYAGRV